MGQDVEPGGQPGDADRVPGERRLADTGHLCQPAGTTHTHQRLPKHIQKQGKPSSTTRAGRWNIILSIRVVLW